MLSVDILWFVIHSFAPTKDFPGDRPAPDQPASTEVLPWLFNSPQAKLSNTTCFSKCPKNYKELVLLKVFLNIYRARLMGNQSVSNIKPLGTINYLMMEDFVSQRGGGFAMFTGSEAPTQEVLRTYFSYTFLQTSLVDVLMKSISYLCRTIISQLFHFQIIFTGSRGAPQASTSSTQVPSNWHLTRWANI